MKGLLKILVLGAIIGVAYFPNKQTIDSRVERWVNFSFCDRPIKYSIGNIDSRFNITEQELKDSIEQASNIWGNIVNKKLFEYDPEGYLDINLVYDDRHELLKSIYAIESELQENKDNISTTESQYEKRRQEVVKELDKLNQEIEYWNERGGAPEEVYEELTRRQKELNNRIEELNKIANNINSNVDKINTEILTLNNKVNNFNAMTQVKPEKGLYTSGINSIDIYFYANKNDLTHTLAHELGHALGLEHVTDLKAIMNPTSSENLLPTPQDIQEVVEVCTNRNRLDLIKGDIQNILYTFITKIETEN